MKGIASDGSPNKKGYTACSLKMVLDELNLSGKVLSKETVYLSICFINVTIYDPR